ncbi:hypothetical protein QYF36_024367 [Acer negundo]|nr:hypothetical protein QYF36_024367 [Acer negundo]
MGCRGLHLLIWVLSILCFACFCCCQFSPQDNYLINCGSPTNATVGNRVFVSDNSASKLLSTPQNVLASTSSKPVTSSSDSVLYQTARVFTGSSKYTFSIRQSDRHWIRLYFYPFVYDKYDMSKAKFSVSSANHALLSDFSVDSSVVKEFSVNVTSSTLDVTFSPSGGSFAFVNALEVISVPNKLITDDASSISPVGKFQGLLWQALETVHRVNMGGPLVTFENDTLWRTWVPDQSFLVEKNLAKSVSNIPAVIYVEGGATRYTAPNTVYGTATRMNSESDPNSNFNVTWDFKVDPGFQYLVRFHFCDIVSLKLNQLYFNVFIDSWIAAWDLDLSISLSNTLAGAYFMDFVTVKTVSNKIRISVGPSNLHSVYPNAILNGLEIMKMNNSQGSLSGLSAGNTGSSSKINVGMIVGVVIGVSVAAVLAGILFIFCWRRRKLAAQGHSKTWIPLSTNGGNSHTMGNPSLPREMVNLAEWAMKWQKKGQLDQIIDSTLAGKIRPDSLRKFAETAEKCLADYGVDRPSMGDVLWNLEYALQLQEAVLQGDPEENSTNVIGELSPQVNNFNQVDNSFSASQADISIANDLSGVSMSRVFSQLVKSEGR